VAIGITSAVGLVAYTAVLSAEAEGQVFNWLLAISGLSSIFTWLTICLCHVRFRSAWKLQGHSLDELPFKSHLGVVGSWVGFGFNALVFVAQFWIGFSPEGYSDMTKGELVEGFFEVYLAAPIIVVSYVGYKVWFKTKFVKLSEVDLRTGIREGQEELAKLKEMERAEERGWPWWKRFYVFFLDRTIFLEIDSA